ncbi:MAG: hypothetical protein Q7U57_20570 [Methylovulum sp.]|nr:hypothetical protein [Methylovulum sp.]
MPPHKHFVTDPKPFAQYIDQQLIGCIGYQGKAVLMAANDGPKQAQQAADLVQQHPVFMTKTQPA